MEKANRPLLMSWGFPNLLSNNMKKVCVLKGTKMPYAALLTIMMFLWTFYLEELKLELL